MDIRRIRPHPDSPAVCLPSYSACFPYHLYLTTVRFCKKTVAGRLPTQVRNEQNGTK